MPNETFSLDGVSCDTVGITLQRAPEFDGLRPIVISQRVPGRNGLLLFDTGAYENRVGRAACYALSGENVQEQIDKINKYLLEKPGYRKLECSYDPGHYWMAFVENGAALENRMRSLNPFQIRFSCMPQRFVPDSLTDITVRSGGAIDNHHSGAARPIIKLKASGSGNITINDRTILILSACPDLRIDCETGNALDLKDGNVNNRIDCEDFPVLNPGRNNISYTGNISNVRITPRWWDK